MYLDNAAAGARMASASRGENIHERV